MLQCDQRGYVFVVPTSCSTLIPLVTVTTLIQVYQSDFNAERSAREKIAGEKADLEEEVRKIRQRQQQIANDIDHIPVTGKHLIRHKCDLACIPVVCMPERIPV